MSVEDLLADLRPLAQECQEIAVGWMQASSPGPEQLAEDIMVITGANVATAALFAADWYMKQYPESPFSADADDDLPEEKAVNVAQWVFAGPQSPENRMKVAAHRLVFDAARRTVLINADREGVAVARHEGDGACTDCIARATLTAKDRNSRSEEVDQVFHPSCEGVFVPVRYSLYAPPEYAKRWRSRVEAARLAGNENPEDIATWLNSH